MTNKTYSPEEKAAYFAAIRKSDPTRLCMQKTRYGLPCNGRAVSWEPIQACKYHAPNRPEKPPKNSNDERPKAVIDSLVILLHEIVFKLDPKEHGDLIKKTLARINEVRPLGIPQEASKEVPKDLSPDERELRRMALLAANATVKSKKAMYWAAYKKMAKKLGIDHDETEARD